MAVSRTITFRARQETEADFAIIEEWCTRHSFPISAVFNAYLPAIAYALMHETHVAEDKYFVRSEFGDVPIQRVMCHGPNKSSNELF